MLLLVRPAVPEVVLDPRMTCTLPREWILFNMARRICQMPQKADRAAFVARQRLVESPDFVLDLEDMVRRVWPLRNEHIKHCWEALGRSAIRTSVAE